MIKKINKLYLSSSLVLFILGVILVQAISSKNKPVDEVNNRVAPLVLGATDTSASNPTIKAGLDLFFEQDFLKMQEDLFRQAPLPQVTYQQKVSIPGQILPPQNVELYDVKNGKLVTIRWNKFAVPPVAVKIFKARTMGGKSKLITEIPGTSKGYHDVDVEVGGDYYYTLVSMGAGDIESTPAGPYHVGPVEDLTPPALPSNISLELKEGVVQITWQDPPDDDLHFINIYRSTRAGELDEKIAQITAGEQIFADKNIESGVTYYYLLVGEDKVGNESKYNLVADELGNKNPFTPNF